MRIRGPYVWEGVHSGGSVAFDDVVCNDGLGWGAGTVPLDVCDRGKLQSGDITISRGGPRGRVVKAARALSAAIVILVLPLSGPWIHRAGAAEMASANLHAGESVGRLEVQGQPFTIYTSAANRGPSKA